VQVSLEQQRLQGLLLLLAGRILVRCQAVHARQNVLLVAGQIAERGIHPLKRQDPRRLAEDRIRLAG
jgi:hypothetical protein